MYDVAVVKCESYDRAEVARSLREAIDAVGGLDFVKRGDRVAIKANLVMFLHPDAAATTHPSVVAELTKMLVERGASVTVGDSPGGPFSPALLAGIYAATDMKLAEAEGALLNKNVEQTEVKFPAAKKAKSFSYTAWLSQADYVIDCCKLKTHGMMGMSCAVKNLFGVVPGTRKPEYHYLYASQEDFADMLVDLCEYVKPVLTVVDAVVGMEGNGPTMGTPRRIGALLAAKSAYKADLVAADIIGLDIDGVPTLRASFERGLIPESTDGLSVYGSIEDFVAADYKKQPIARSDFSQSRYRIAYTALVSGFRPQPVVDKKRCVGCAKCADICPAKAIAIKEGRAAMERKKCIHCFCCQEFCPQGAITPRRPLIARIFGGRNR